MPSISLFILLLVIQKASITLEGLLVPCLPPANTAYYIPVAAKLLRPYDNEPVILLPIFLSVIQNISIIRDC